MCCACAISVYLVPVYVSLCMSGLVVAIGHRFGVTAPTGGGCPPPQGLGDRRTSPAMDRCDTGEGGVWVNPGGGDHRYSPGEGEVPQLKVVEK